MKKLSLVFILCTYFCLPVFASVIIRQAFVDGGKYIKVIPKKISNDQIAAFWLRQGARRFGMVVPEVTFVDVEKNATQFCCSNDGYFFVRIKEDFWYLGSNEKGILQLFLMSTQESLASLNWKFCGDLNLSMRRYSCEWAGKEILVVDPMVSNGKIYEYPEADCKGY